MMRRQATTVIALVFVALSSAQASEPELTLAEKIEKKSQLQSALQDLYPLLSKDLKDACTEPPPAPENPSAEVAQPARGAQPSVPRDSTEPDPNEDPVPPELYQPSGCDDAIDRHHKRIAEQILTMKTYLNEARTYLETGNESFARLKLTFASGIPAQVRLGLSNIEYEFVRLNLELTGDSIAQLKAAIDAG